MMQEAEIDVKLDEYKDLFKQQAEPAQAENGSSEENSSSEE